MRLLAILLVATSLTAQSVTPASVDALFKDVNDATPGYAVAVIRDGKTVLARGYGMADLERPTPITAQTVFDIGSTAKQFTTAAVLLLEQEGKLSIDDEVRKHIPELPAYERPVTIRHLIHHTSGIRDYLTLMGLSGYSHSNDYSDEETLSWITRQKGLNFPPGDEHLYSNSGYYLLGQIVERASGTSLRDYAKKKIFDPLGMTVTHFHDDPWQVVKNRAIGYTPAPLGFRIDLSMYHVVGDGGLYTTVEELAKWDANFADPKVGGKALIDALQRKGKLTSGKEIEYAGGLMHGAHRGLPTVAHGGGWAGYRAEMMRFPAQRLSVIVLTNNNANDPSAMARKIAELYLAPEIAAAAKPAQPDAKPDAKPAAAAAAVSLSPAELEKVAGLYYASVGGFYRTLAVRDGKLWYVRGGGRPSELRPLSATRFEMVGPVAAYVTITETGARLDADGQDSVEMRRIVGVAPAAGDLAGYAGSFAAAELMAPHHLAVKDGALTIRIGHQRDGIPLQPRERDVFEGRGVILRFERDANGAVTGYSVAAGRVKNIHFTRLPS